MWRGVVESSARAARNPAGRCMADILGGRVCRKRWACLITVRVSGPEATHERTVGLCDGCAVTPLLRIGYVLGEVLGRDLGRLAALENRLAADEEKTEG